jgi:hypothetical protein
VPAKALVEVERVGLLLAVTSGRGLGTGPLSVLANDDMEVAAKVDLNSSSSYTSRLALSPLPDNRVTVPNAGEEPAWYVGLSRANGEQV